MNKLSRENEDAVLELNQVTLRRAGRNLVAQISLTVAAGEHWALLGANGAGKSTLMGLCGASSFPSSGTVRILGEQLGRVELQSLRRSIGHVNPRHRISSPLSIHDVVLTGLTGSSELQRRWEPSAPQLASANALLEQFGLTHKANYLWPMLSQGERSRALIARALIPNPKLLLLDEPCTGLDVAAREELLETVGQLAHTRPHLSSLMVTHHLEELPVSTSHALLMADGRTVAAGPAKEVITSENISAAFRHPLTVEYRHQRWSARVGRRNRIPQAGANEAKQRVMTESSGSGRPA